MMGHMARGVGNIDGDVVLQCSTQSKIRKRILAMLFDLSSYMIAVNCSAGRRMLCLIAAVHLII